MKTSAAAANSELKAKSERIGSSAMGRRDEARQNTVRHRPWSGLAGRASHPVVRDCGDLVCLSLRQGRISHDGANRGGVDRGASRELCKRRALGMAGRRDTDSDQPTAALSPARPIRPRSQRPPLRRIPPRRVGFPHSRSPP